LVGFRRLRGWPLVRARLPRVLFIAGVLACAAWTGGFVIWLNNLPLAPEGRDIRTDGIVVLTGGAHRIELGVGLLAGGAADRLLISGVNQQIEDETLRSVIGISKDLFSCCIDLGRVAQNTRENAIEAADWARRKDYKSLRIVTAYDHMPRSLVEFRRTMPGAEFFAHPVSPETWDGISRPGYGGLAMEYTKYWIALIRYRFTPPPPITAAPDLSEIDQ